ETGLGGDDGRHPVLHPRPSLRAGGALDAEGAVMIAEWRASGQEVAVVGLGKSGVAATLLLRAREVPVYASDSGTGPALDAQAGELRQAGAAADVGPPRPDRRRRAPAAAAPPGGA